MKKTIFYLFSLIVLLVVSCHSSTPKENIAVGSRNQATDKTLSDQLITFIDTAANRFADGRLSEEKLKVLADSFAVYFPIMLDQQGKAVPDTVVYVKLHDRNYSKQSDRIYISLPIAMGKQLTFKSLTNHFGPLGAEPPLFRAHKSPPPVSIDLKKHLGNKTAGLFLQISAAHFPEEAENQMVYIEIVKSKGE
ncbi:hypothetical protein [Pedobacter sp.]|jgi:hypothetical protein|uniref:hypothetical protein n=1 Tax=Pedobacter sp. TaxID=1411316 RepID=UPI002CFC1BD2|nr:hypothetical protein [Pedobacter sp.]HWW38692.1 hypothetical protein [Pedobacter sp.]